jgi:hypothetical protein
MIYNEFCTYDFYVFAQKKSKNPKNCNDEADVISINIHLGVVGVHAIYIILLL